MSTVQVIWLVLLLLVLQAGAGAKDYEPAAWLGSLPSAYGVYQSGEGVRTYDEPGLGASRSYQSPSGILITLYLYDLGIASIEPGIKDPTIKKACQQAMGDIVEMGRQGQYAGVKMQEESEVTLVLPSGRKVEMLSVSYTYAIINPETKNAVKVQSQLFVTGTQDHIFKIRMSRREGGDAEAVKEAEETLKQVMDAVLSPPASGSREKRLKADV